MPAEVSPAHAEFRDPREDELEPLCRRAWLETRGRSTLDYLAARAAQNRITRAMAQRFAPIDVLLLPTTAEFPPPVGLYHRVLRDLEVPLIAATLSVTRGNQIKAAEILGLNRNTLRKKIRDLDLRGVRGFR